MKKEDIYFIFGMAAIFLPFFIIDPLYEWYKGFNAAHGMVMSFIKFAVLSTMGEMLGSRISSGSYCPKGFGVVPRMVVWGILGMGINMAMIIFSKGTPLFLEYIGVAGAAEALEGEFTSVKLLTAFAVSVAMNTIFAPLFMTLHKVTDAHINSYGGSARALIHRIPMGEILSNLNWKVQWGFVFKKTIPLFWYPAHTITFLLPSEARVLFAALLGVVLGVLLAVAAKKR